MNLKDFIEKLLRERKTVEEIKVALLEFDGDFTAEEVKTVLDGWDAKQKKAAELAKMDAKKAEQPKIDEKAFNQKIADLETKLNSALEQIELKEKQKPEYKFKSWLGDFVVQRDETWRAKLMEMLIADRNKDYQKAFELSGQFNEGNKLFKLEEKLLRGDAVTGSYAVPEEWSDLVFSIAQLSSNAWAKATKMVQSVGDKMYLLGSGDVTFTEVADQSTALTQSEPTLTQNSIDLIDAGAFSLLHDNLISDSNVNMVQVLANAYARGLQKYLKRATMVQNISASSDLIDGVYSITGVASTALIDGVTGVIAVQDIINLVHSVDETFYEDGEFELNLSELLALTNLDYAGDGRRIPLVDQKAKTIYGRPYALNNQMPATMNSTTGARTGGSEATIIYGKPSEMQITFKGGMNFESSRDFKFTNRQTTFRGFVRWGMDIVNTEAWGRLTGITRP